MRAVEWVIFQRNDTGRYGYIPYRKGASIRGREIKRYIGTQDEVERHVREMEKDHVILKAL